VTYHDDDTFKSQAAKKMIVLADKYIAAGEYENAVVVIETAVTYHDDYIFKSQAAEKMIVLAGKYIAAAEKMIVLAENYSLVADEYENAEGVIEKAVAYDDNRRSEAAIIMIELAEKYIVANKIENAERVIDKAVAYDDNRRSEAAEKMIELAEKYNLAAKTEDAERVIDKAEEYDPTSALIYKGFQRANAGLYDQALEFWRQAEDYDEIGFVPEIQIAQILLDQGVLDSVEDLVQDPVVRQIVNLYDLVYYQGRAAEALEILRQTNQDNPDLNLQPEELFLELSAKEVISQGEIASGAQVTGTVQPYKEDEWRFDATAGQRVTISLIEDNSNLDTYLILRGPNGDIISFNDDGGEDYNSLIEFFELPETGTYSIFAKGYSDSSGNYVLTLEIANP
jgi:tetratricopeptide (TPR) repeat protein